MKTMQLQQIFTIAGLKYRELLRERLFIVTVAVAVGLIGLSLILGTLTFDEAQRILADFGLASVEICLVFCSIFLGSFLFAKDIERQTCLVILSRPITRTSYFVGQFLGLASVIFTFAFSLTTVIALLMSESFLLQNWLGVFASLLLKSFFLIVFSLTISLWLKPYLTIVLGFTVYFCGHWLQELNFFAQKTADPVFNFAKDIITYIVPSFYRYNFKSYEFLKNGIPAEAILWMWTHGLLWILIYVVVGIALFRRKQIV